MKGTAGQRLLTQRILNFIDAFYTGAKGDSQEAARLAGYRDPRQAGPRLARRFRDILEAKRRDWRSKVEMQPPEILEKLTVLARNTDQSVEHKDQLRAIELLGKHFGMFDRKGEADRGTLIREINVLFRSLEQAARRKALGAGVVDGGAGAEVVEVVGEELPATRSRSAA